MKQIIYKLLLFLFVITTVSFELLAQPLPINRWHFIQTDSTSQKRGNWAEPSWLRYFELNMEGINNDGYKDIIAGHYFYINPGRNKEGKWARSDLGTVTGPVASISPTFKEHLLIECTPFE